MRATNRRSKFDRNADGDSSDGRGSDDDPGEHADEPSV